MRFLRMLTNSLLAGALGAAYLTVLVLQLNPQIPLAVGTTWRWFATLGASLRRAPRGALLRGRWWCASSSRSTCCRPDGRACACWRGWAAAAAAVAATLMWLNVRGFHAALTEDADAEDDGRRDRDDGRRRRCCSVIAIAHYSFGRRGSRVGASLFVHRGVRIAGAAARGARSGRSSCRRRLRAAARGRAAAAAPCTGRGSSMLLLDGASLDYMLPRVAEGRLPAFARLLDKGAVMDLATVRPTQPDPVWAAVGDRNVSVEERRAIGGVVLRARRRRGPSTCCPITASRTRWCTLDSSATSRTRRDDLARAAALVDRVAAPGSASASCAGR